MYIMNERSGRILNSTFVVEFFVAKTSDCTLLSYLLGGNEKPYTLERYKTQKDATEALCSLMQALVTEQSTFYVPESTFYFEESLRKDARVKRRGGS